MAWTAPTTRATGNLITASIWNVDLVDNLTYLETSLDDISVAQPARAIDTTYQNTSGKIRFVTINAYCRIYNASGTALNGTSLVEAKSDSATPPTTVVAVARSYALVDGMASGSHEIRADIPMGFYVFPNHYYRMVTTIGGDGVTPGFTNWTEWDLLQ